MSSFSPEKRLHYPWEYRRFFSNSEVIRLSECVVFRIPNERGHFRVGITCKVRTDSVRRNRIKRRVRESFRLLNESLGSYDYNVVIPSSKRPGFPYPQRLFRCLNTEFPRALASKQPRNK